MWVNITGAIYFLQFNNKRAENVTAKCYLDIFVKFIPPSRAPLSIPRAGFSSLAPWWEISYSRSRVLLALSIFNVPGMGCVCFCEIISGIFKSRLGSHGYTWCLACERRCISSRRFTFRAEGSNNRKSSAFAGHSNWDGILSKNPTGNLKFIKKGKASGHLFLPIWFHQKIFCGQSEDWRSLGQGSWSLRMGCEKNGRPGN